MDARTAELIKEHEGLRLKAYKDHLGYLTIGYGRLIDERRNGGISQAEADFLFENDYKRIISQVERLPYFTGLSPARKAVLLNMAFQLGIGGLFNFKKTLALVASGRYTQAASEMLNSKWARVDTPERASQLSKMMASGEFST